MKLCPRCRGSCRDDDISCVRCGTLLVSVPTIGGGALVGMRLAGRYDLEELVREGSMGWVYRATDAGGGAPVAAKIMKPTAFSEDVHLARFRREAQVVSRLNHPHIVSVVRWGEERGAVAYLVTEFLQGRSLAEIIHDEAPLPVERAVRIASQLLAALEFAHGAGIVHRDVKPDNLVVLAPRDGEDFVKVIDFGIARITGDHAAQLTVPGQVLGTPRYMAPEQIRGEDTGPAVDLYAVAVILYEMLTGIPVFPDGDLVTVLHRHLSEPPPPIRELRDGLANGEALQRVIDRALAKHPTDRFADAHSLRRALVAAAERATAVPGTEVCPRCGRLAGELDVHCPSCGTTMRFSRPPPAPAATPLPPTAPDLSGCCAQACRLHGHCHPRADAFWSRLPRRLPEIDRPEVRMAIESLLRGDVPVLQLVGPPGSGKTRCARVAARRAAEAGLCVVPAGADAADVPPPWAALSGALALVLRLPPRPSAEAVARGAREDGTNNERLAGRLELLGLPGPLDAAVPALRRHTAAAAARDDLVSRDAGRRLLLCEDVDRWDLPSRELLPELASACTASGVRLLATSVAPALGPAAAGTVPLPPLAVSVLSARVLAQQPVADPGHLRALGELFSAGAGNALWTEQALGLIAESGVFPRGTAGEIVLARTRRLPVRLRRVLEGLAVLGGTAAQATVAFVTQSDAIDDVALDLLAGSAFLEPSEPPPVLRLAHPLMAEAIRIAIPADVRRELHRRALHALSGMGAPHGVLAFHARGAGETLRAAHHYLQAGDRARRVLDDDAARRCYAAAVELLSTRVDDRADAALHAQLADRINSAQTSEPAEG
ncbi:MAG: protein kinase [Deltaproteobacteria bacterium]|nr:protein kinase [Deltaproteobacteria bacterium]